MDQVRSLLANLSPKGRLALAGSAIGIVLVAFLLMRVAGAPSYSTVLTGLDPATTGKITSTLDAKGIGYKLENNGTALAVDSSKTAQARVALAEAGLPGTSQPGFSQVFDKQKLGTSDFQQQVAYQRGLEGEIAQTIEQVQGVSGARVQLVLPDDQLFAADKQPARAAVLLSGDASSLDPGAVRGIASLVSSSVKGLNLSNVSITDGTGQLLWPKSGDDAGGIATKMGMQGRYEQQLEGSLDALLLRTLGPGKAQVSVNADVNADQSTKDQLAYAKKGVPTHKQSDQETLKGGGAGGAGGTAGAGGNIPSYAGAAGGGGNSNYKHKTTSTDLLVGKTVTRTKVAPGAVNKLHVAVLVDKSVPPAALAGLKQTIASAAGIDPKRGDTLAVTSVAFAKQPAAAAGPSAIAPILGYVKWLFLGGALAAFVFFMRRHLRRREDEDLAGEPMWIREIEARMPINELTAGPVGERAPVPALAAAHQPAAREQVGELAAREPERVAQQIRAWMAEE